MEINCDKKCRKICFLWGGLGAIVPIALTVATVDWSTLAGYFNEENTLRFIGYGFRVAVFFVVGGLWAYFHKSEYEPLKLFQLGIIAPSLITGMISGNNLGAQNDDANQFSSLFTISIISSAYAQDGDGQTADKEDEGSVIREIVKGFLGQK